MGKDYRTLYTTHTYIYVFYQHLKSQRELRHRRSLTRKSVMLK